MYVYTDVWFVICSISSKTLHTVITTELSLAQNKH